MLAPINADTNNRISGFSYDSTGNLLSDGTNSYSWNAESEIATATGVNYHYDGDGNRVQKSNGKLYWYGAGSQVLDESDLSGNITDEYVFFGGKRVAHRDSAGTLYYYAEDFLGSSRVITTATGVPCYDADFYPFGGERSYINTCGQNYKFAGKERDSETGNDDFGARYYSSNFGRWLSPDWSAIPAPVPYADLTNPQTLNLYQFVKNDPETFTDPDGHSSTSMYQLANPAGGFWDPTFATTMMDVKSDLENSAPPMPTQQQNQNQTQQQTTAPANSRTDVVLHGREYAPTPQVETPALWVMDWTASACSATGCSRPTAANEKQTITLVESENGGPWKKGGDPSQGVAHDHFSVEPRTINQHWFVDGKRVQLVVGKDSKGNLIKTWEVRVDIKKFGDRPVYSAVP